MNEIKNWLESLMPETFAASDFLSSALIICLAVLAVSILGRLIFGKKSVLNRSVSSAIGILFIYIVTVVIYSTGANLSFLLSPLPFVSLSGEHLHIFNFLTADYREICYQLLSMIVLAFLVNLVDSWLPQGKKVIGWYFYRCLTVLLAMLLHVLVTELFTAFMPADILAWAPTIVLGILVLLMLLGGLKLLVGAALAFINPLLGILYTFFFASFLGKRLSKAVLTTAILTGLVLILNYLGTAAIYIGTAALAGYIPLLLVLLLVWYVIGHLF